MKKNIIVFNQMKEKKLPVTWVTAYSYPFAMAAEKADIDMILVGDSGGMVELGYQTTNPVTMDEMISFSKAARKGAPNTFLVGDMPQGSYEASTAEAVSNAMRFAKEACCDAVKLEGGARVCDKITAIANSGILVIGHLGLTPQSTVSFGGYKVQGKTVVGFEELMMDAFAVQDAGCSMLLLEAIPAQVGQQIAAALKIPVLGIGAGLNVDGQLIIMHDLTGFYKNFRPWFAKCYIPSAIDKYIETIKSQQDIKKYGIDTRNDGLMSIVEIALSNYCFEVRNKLYPSEEYTYPIKEEDLALLKKSGFWRPILDNP